MEPQSENNQGIEADSLETSQTVPETPVVPPADPAPASSEPQPVAPSAGQASPEPPKPPETHRSFLARIRSINVYLLVFLLIIVLALFITYAAYQKSRQTNSAPPTTTSSEAINEDVLDQLRSTDVSIGQPKQILSVEANAVFAGSVLIRGDFETAGQIKASGPISGSSINVSGTGNFQTLQAGKLQVSGDSQLQGNLAVQKSLAVSGSGNFGGTLSASKLNIQSIELSGDLLLSKHIDISGGNPGKSNGSALGGGGTSSVSGTDTAGTININTGNSPGAGCFVTVSFTQRFNTPHVVVTPIGSSGASINYYVTRSSGSFSLCTASAAPAHKNFSFDYIVID